MIRIPQGTTGKLKVFQEFRNVSIALSVIITGRNLHETLSEIRMWTKLQASCSRHAIQYSLNPSHDAVDVCLHHRAV